MSMKLSIVRIRRAEDRDVMAGIVGHEAAAKLLRDLRAGGAPQDALLEAVRDAGDGERLRGFARALQKAIERA